MIFRNEIYKLLHQKMFVLVAICAVLLNIYISCSQTFGMYCPAKEYKEYYALAEGKTFSEAYDYSIARRDNMFGGWEAGKWEVRQMMDEEIEQLKAVGTYRQYLQSIDDAAATMTPRALLTEISSKLRPRMTAFGAFSRSLRRQTECFWRLRTRRRIYFYYS